MSLEELPRVVEGPAAHDVVGAEGQRVDAVPVARQRPHQLPKVTPRPVQRPHLHAPQGAGLEPANRVCSYSERQGLLNRVSPLTLMVRSLDAVYSSPSAPHLQHSTESVCWARVTMHSPVRTFHSRTVRSLDELASRSHAPFRCIGSHDSDVICCL